MEQQLRVYLLADSGETLGALRRDLAREGIDSIVLPIAELPEGPEDGLAGIVLLVAPGTADAHFKRFVDWADRAAIRPALIGFCPGGDADDAVAALEVGFDDFVAGRSSSRELACRLRALVRRRAGSEPSGRMPKTQSLSLDVVSQEAWVNGQSVGLSPTEVAVLRTLLRAQGEALTRGAILDRAWGQDTSDVGERAVDNVILRLRRKLGDPSLIETVRGVGFRMSMK